MELVKSPKFQEYESALVDALAKLSFRGEHPAVSLTMYFAVTLGNTVIVFEEVSVQPEALVTINVG